MKIIISGTTGVGKSTTVNEVKRLFEEQGKKVRIVGEMVVDNPYFDLYFDNLSEWGFLAQIDFLFERFDQFVKIQRENIEDSEVIIFDRHYLEDIIFAELKQVREATSAALTNTYRQIFKQLLNKLEKQFEKPDYMFMLKASFDTVKERMNKRGREQEALFSDNYWQDLYYRYYGKSTYRQIFVEYTKDYIEIDTDFISADKAAETIITYIKNRE